MIDLHVHLDGSITPDTIISIARKNGILLPTYREQELFELISVPRDCRSLNDYLRCFDIPQSVSCGPASIEEKVFSLVKRLDADGLLYAEIRFGPQNHATADFPQRKVVLAALRGMNAALRKSHIKTNLILMCMRGSDNLNRNLETVDVAAEFLGHGVAGIDLAGAEALYPTENFGEVFAYARERGLPFTIHAGEAAGADSIRKAIEFGATRIGHGTHLYEDERLMELVRDRGITLEMCPTSNLQTKAVARLEDFPLLRYLRFGIRVTVNTDNMTVSRTTVAGEFELLRSQFPLTDEDELTLLRNSAHAAFLPPHEKKELCRKLEMAARSKQYKKKEQMNG